MAIFIIVKCFSIGIGAVMYLHSFEGGFYYLISGSLGLIFIMSLWFRDVIREGTYEGMHTRMYKII